MLPVSAAVSKRLAQMPSFRSLEATDFLANNPWGWDSYIVLGVHREGSFFGEHTCLLGNKRVASVVATAFCELQALSRLSLEKVARQWPELIDEIMKLLDECVCMSLYPLACACCLLLMLCRYLGHDIMSTLPLRPNGTTHAHASCANKQLMCSTVDEYASNPAEADRARGMMNSQMPSLAVATMQALQRAGSGKLEGYVPHRVPTHAPLSEFAHI